jgi:glutaminase
MEDFLAKNGIFYGGGLQESGPFVYTDGLPGKDSGVAGGIA